MLEDWICASDGCHNNLLMRGCPPCAAVIEAIEKDTRHGLPPELKSSGEMLP
jgi:hypothetical protein